MDTEHNIEEKSNGLYECKNCGKVATSSRKFRKTKCEEPDRLAR